LDREGRESGLLLPIARVPRHSKEGCQAVVGVPTFIRGMTSFLRRSAFAPVGEFWAVSGLTVCALALGGGAIFTDRLGDHPLIFLTLPAVLAAVSLGLRGGMTFGLLASLIATAWWFENDQPGGLVWLSSRFATYLIVGAVVGWMIDSRADLLRRLTHHNELTLDLIATASFDGYFIQLNPAFSRTLGFSNEELKSKPLLEFVHPDDRESTLKAIEEQTEQGNEVLQFQNRYLTKSGGFRWLEWTSRPDEQAKELIAVARDITDRKQLEMTIARHTELLEQAVRERTSELEAARLETLQRLALAAEYRDEDTHQHTERVGSTAALLAELLGLTDEEVALIRLAAPLHDVGKLAVPDGILLKPGKLTTDEFRRMQEHVIAGASLLAGSASQVLQLAAQIALTHHERWDGTGYPNQLRGEDIPISGRIVAVADVFDALTHDRPYKAAWPVKAAVAEIGRLSGRQFDPRVVAAFDQLDHDALLSPNRQRHLAIVA